MGIQRKVSAAMEYMIGGAKGRTNAIGGINRQDIADS